MEKLKMKANFLSKATNPIPTFVPLKLFCLLAIAFLFCSVGAVAQEKSEKDKLGKVFIKAAATKVDGQEVPDADREDSAKGMREKPGKFILVDNESEANFLIVLNERTSTPHSGRRSSKNLMATLYVREASEWKPATVLKSQDNTFWSVATGDIMKKAAKWVKENLKNQ
jgi:hypothetical protein